MNRIYKKKHTNWLIAILGLIFVFHSSGCRKFLEVNQISDQLYADQVFENEGTSNSAIAAIYHQSKNLIIPTVLFGSLYGDDVKSYSANAFYDNFSNNVLRSTDETLPWNSLYAVIYASNAAIEGLNQSKGISEKARSYYIGEAKFNRAFCYFYLVNLFGDVPFITSTDLSKNAKPFRTSTLEIYQLIVSDLIEAQTLMANDYAFTGGERTRANNFVASALLARVYLYLKDYGKAESQASKVINSGLYSLLPNPTGIFAKNNTEAILQLANNSSENNQIASNFLFTATPGMQCTRYLLEAFETNDLRKSNWIKSQVYGVTGETIMYPYKFTSTEINPNEFYTVLRLSEQYLIRAEARAMNGDLNGCVDDVNLIRFKHGGLSSALPAPVSVNDAMDLIIHERQVELFTEGMHRFLDLKRTGRLEAVKLAENPTTWKSEAALYPIPLTEMQRNPNLFQNPNYR
jgi:hypothetical protein